MIKRFMKLSIVCLLTIMSLYLNNDIVHASTDYPVVRINNYSSNDLIYVYTTATSNSAITYLSNSNIYGGDAAFIKESNGRYLIKINGIQGWVSKNDVRLINSNSATTPSYYTINNNKELVHYISYNPEGGSYIGLTLGPAPTYLNMNEKYYSYDGNYFYKTLNQMNLDYLAENFNNSVNKNNPFFNYYQYLPYHSLTNYSADDINNYLKKRGYTSKPTSYSTLTSSQSMLYNEGKSFIDSQNYYGTNALLTFSVAINESGWGRSNYAVNRNNLFGHNAVDSNPDDASRYSSIKEAIDTHNKVYVNWGYLDYPDFRYFGGHLGNKASGMNVKYASDAYWGEKAAANYYAFDKTMGMKDYNKYTLGIKEGGFSINIRKDATTNSSIISALNNASYQTINMPVIILEEKNGESLEGNSNWYRIQSDHLLNANRTRQIFNQSNPSESYETKYNFSNNYGYIHSSLVIKTNNGSNSDIPIPDEPDIPEPIYKPGDVNGDGVVSSLDYIKVKNHIMGTKKLTNDELKRADVNKDSKVTSLDYIKIKNHIMGINKLF